MSSCRALCASVKINRTWLCVICFLCLLSWIRMFEPDTWAVCSRYLEIHWNSARHFWNCKFHRFCLLLGGSKHSRQLRLCHIPFFLLNLEAFWICHWLFHQRSIAAALSFVLLLLHHEQWGTFQSISATFSNVGWLKCCFCVWEILVIFGSNFWK